MIGPRILARTECALEVRTCAFFLAMDPYVPDFLRGAMCLG